MWRSLHTSFGARSPAPGKPAIGGERVGGTREADRVPVAGAQARLLRLLSEVERDVGEPVTGVDDERCAVGEVGVLEQLEHRGDVAGEEQVVVAQVADDLAVGLRERCVSMALPVPLALRAIEEAHTGIGQERLQRGARVVLDAVADDEQLDRAALLGERAPHAYGRSCGMTVRRDENRRVDHGDRTSSAAARSRRRPSAPSAGARLRRRSAAEMLDEHPQLGEQRAAHRASPPAPSSVRRSARGRP